MKLRGQSAVLGAATKILAAEVGSLRLALKALTRRRVVKFLTRLKSRPSRRRGRGARATPSNSGLGPHSLRQSLGSDQRVLPARSSFTSSQSILPTSSRSATQPFEATYAGR